MTKFVDIEIGADIGQIRLYTTDEDYETYDGEDILNLINNLFNENEQLKLDLKVANDGADLYKDINEALEKENEQLKHNNKMLSIKMSEVSTKYRLLKEFSEDTNPNEAVKTVLHELMMITKEYR